MADYKEVVHERLYVRVPGGDKLRKTASGRLKYMLAAGWRETDRWQHPEYITIKLERSGHAPTMKILPKPPPPPQRMNRGGGRGGSAAAAAATAAAVVPVAPAAAARWPGRPAGGPPAPAAAPQPGATPAG